MFIDPNNPDTPFAAEPIAAAAERLVDAQSASQPTPSLCELHAQWAELVSRCDARRQEIAKLEKWHPAGPPFVQFGDRKLYTDADVDDATDWLAEKCPDDSAAIMKVRAGLKEDIAADLAKWQAAGHRLACARAKLAEDEAAIDSILDSIEAAPINTIEDVAVLVDIALGRVIDITNETRNTVPFTAQLLRALIRLVRDFEFASLKRDLPPAELAALLAEPNDHDDAAEPAARIGAELPIADLPPEVARSLPELRRRYAPLQEEEMRPGYSDEQVENLALRQLQIEEAAAAAQATGMLDLRAKAEILEWLWREFDPEREDDVPTRLALSLCRDIGRLSDG